MKKFSALLAQGPCSSSLIANLHFRSNPITIYLQPHQRVQAWVRFGARAIRVDAKLAPSTPLAAGIEFRAGDQAFRCWVWGNANGHRSSFGPMTARTPEARLR